jgi:O-methyltransferase
MAELGVYKGNFSRRLNMLFPDRKLYLFDTFKGFSDKDVAIERKKGYSDASQDFSNTSIEFVRSKMPHPESCIFKPGYFPESAEGVEDRFCLVSIDADLYEPVYQGLRFFYPQLQKGGYIFVHDFNNSAYVGAKNAVVTYCQEHDVRFVPIPDCGGTVIITK